MAALSRPGNDMEVRKSSPKPTSKNFKPNEAEKESKLQTGKSKKKIEKENKKETKNKNIKEATKPDQTKTIIDDLQVKETVKVEPKSDQDHLISSNNNAPSPPVRASTTHRLDYQRAVQSVITNNTPDSASGGSQACILL